MHGLNVQINAKSDIQKQTEKKLIVLNNMTTKFQKVVTKDLNDFENNLDNEINNYILSEDNGDVYKTLINPPYNLKKSQIAKLSTTDATKRNKIIETKVKARKKFASPDQIRLDSIMRQIQDFKGNNKMKTRC